MEVNVVRKLGLYQGCGRFLAAESGLPQIRLIYLLSPAVFVPSVEIEKTRYFNLPRCSGWPQWRTLALVRLEDVSENSGSASPCQVL